MGNVLRELRELCQRREAFFPSCLQNLASEKVDRTAVRDIMRLFDDSVCGFCLGELRHL